MPNWETFEDFLTEAQATPTDQRQQLVAQLLSERDTFPWINGNQATFVYTRRGAESVALNMDKIRKDPPLVAMQRLDGTHLFYLTVTFETDDLLDYLIAVNDPMTPLKTETQLAERIKKHWRTDPHNPLGIKTANVDVSVLRMPYARPFPDWTRMTNVNSGNTIEHRIDSPILGITNRRVWVHTPPNYADSGLAYPLLIVQDGQWATGPLQIPAIMDALVKHGRMTPIVVAMIQSGDQQVRMREYITGGDYNAFIMEELLPFLQQTYRLDGSRIGMAGAAAGAIAAADVAIQNPDQIEALIMLSPPLGKGAAQDKLMQYAERFRDADLLPRRIFQAVGRYEEPTRFLEPAHQLATLLGERTDTEYRFVELGSGHGLITFRSIMPEALAWVFPGWASV